LSDVITTLDILIDGLSKKKKAMVEILEYTKAQEKLLAEDDVNLKTFNNVMKNKQFRIDAIKQIDDGFEPTYERIRGHLENNSDLYRNYINQMKELIKEIGDISIKIQVLEQQNHSRFLNVTKGLKGDVKNFRTSKKAVTSYYDTYNKQQESVRKNFYDRKK